LKLVKFRASGFRCLKEIDWVPSRDLIILTGPNDGGKTSVLDAINLFLDKRSNPDEVDFTYIDDQNQCEEIVTEGIFKLSSTEKREIEYQEDFIHIRKIFSRVDGRSTYEYKTLIHSDPRLQRDLNSIAIAELRDLADEYGIELTNRREKEVIISHFKEWLKDQTLEEGYLELSTTIKDLMPEIKIFRSARTLDPENEINATLRNSFSTRIRGERYSGRLKEIESEIQSEMRRDLDELEEIVKTYCPDISGIIIDPYFDFARGFQTSRLLLKKGDGPPIDLDKEGEGRKRRITLGVYEWREKIFTKPANDEQQIALILAFDEPDTHLDYISQRKILDIIKRIAEQERNSVIITTHSLNLIDRVSITDIVHLKLIDNSTHVEMLKTEDPELIDMFLYQISDNMGLKNSIMLNERCFLIVEGETEMYSLPVLYRKLFPYSLQAGGIRLLNGEGCGGVRSLAKFLNDNMRNVIFLVDNDTRANPKNRIFTPEKLTLDGFDINSQVFFIGKEEYEDAFSDELYLKAASAFWKKHDASEWKIEEFTELRNLDDFTDKLLRLIRRETHSNTTKRQIGLGLAKSIEHSEEIPDSIKICLNKANELSA